MHENIPSLKSRGNCRRCGEERVGDNLYISRSSKNKDGYQYQCLRCHREIASAAVRRRYSHDAEFRKKTKEDSKRHYEAKNRHIRELTNTLLNAYRLYVLEDDWKSQNEIEEEILDTLCNVLGTDEFAKWYDSIESGVPK